MERRKLNLLPEGFTEGHESASNDELKSVIIDSSKTVQEQKKAMKEDPEICARKEDLKHLRGGYRDVIKAHEAKIEWCVEKLEERGNI